MAVAIQALRDLLRMVSRKIKMKENKLMQLDVKGRVGGAVAIAAEN